MVEIEVEEKHTKHPDMYKITHRNTLLHLGCVSKHIYIIYLKENECNTKIY